MTSHPPIVVNTRDEGTDGPLARALQERGLASMACPMIAIAPPEDPGPFLAAVGRLAHFDWVAFTSGHAIDAISQYPEWRTAVRNGTLPRVAAVGGTSAARLAADGVTMAVVPDGVGAEALAETMVRAGRGSVRGARVLWPRGDRALKTFGDALTRAGALVTAPIAYRTLPPPQSSVATLTAGLASKRFAAIAFCSPSSAQHLAEHLGDPGLSALKGRMQIASIGPTTSAALRALGLDADVQAGEPSVASLAEAIAAQLRVTPGDPR